MTRYEIKDPDSGEVVGSYCADRTVSAETRAALEALARAARKDLVEVPPPLPAEPPNGFVGRLGKVVWVRMWRGDSDPARWCEPGNYARFTWEQVCGFNPGETMIELRPDPAVQSPDRQVLDAALAWVAYVHKAPTSPNIWGDDHDHALIEAVDAYNASAALRSVRDEEEINS